MSVLFEPFRIQEMVLRNRFVRSATYDGMADRQGHITDRQLAMVETLAEGGVGLIVVGAVHVDLSGWFAPVQTSIASDDCIPGLAQMADRVHERGGRIAVQLFHGGREAATYQGRLGRQAVAPTYVPNDPYCAKTYYRGLEPYEIGQIVQAFGDAAARAQEAGIDAVQIHAAHAYLFSQFLSPFTNRRDDEWGGSLENRLRFHREVLHDIREKVGDEYPLLIKLGLKDHFENGLALTEGFEAAEQLTVLGLDALEISYGLRGSGYEQTEFRTKIDTLEKEAYLSAWAREMKRRTEIPVILSGGVRSLGRAEALIQEGDADMVALCRPLIREPGLIREWEQGDPQRATCISCNGCLEALRRLEPLRCVVEK
jgi:2,4-dienoyl-CoA reductase-like NADH-dependent reductase (Old Yellow Enzyme family)